MNENSFRLFSWADGFWALSPLIVLTVLLSLGAVENAQSHQGYLPPHYRIASSKDVKGKGELHQCFPYAQELQRRLYFEANLLSSLVFFNWKDGTGEIGSHVVVHYYDQWGNQWLADNQKEKPIQVMGMNKAEKLSQMYPDLVIEHVPTLAESL